MAAKRNRPRQFPDEVYHYVRRRMLEPGATPASVKLAVETKYPDWAHISEGTIRNYTQGLKPSLDVAWNPLESSPEECRAAAPFVLYQAVNTPPGRPAGSDWPKQTEVEWMLRVRAWAPDLGDGEVWSIGRYLALGDQLDQHRVVQGLLVGAKVTATDEGFAIRARMGEIVTRVERR